MIYLHKLTILTFAFVICVFANMQNAYAGCAAGLPCETAPSASELLDPTTGPNAAKSDGDLSCDANFMNQIYAKGFIEAEREMVITNALIMKPDSVLEYTCFDQLAALTARNSASSPVTRPLFGETDAFRNVNVTTMNGSVTYTTDMGVFYLDTRIRNIVLSALQAYSTGSFSHDFLGGAATGDNHTFSTTLSGNYGVCDYMYNIHHIAKCDDFALNTGFMSFESAFGSPALTDPTDPRVLPVVCSAPHPITTSMLDVSKNETWTFASFDEVDTALMNLELARGPSGGACENADPIPTGVMVNYEERDVDINGNSVIVDQYIYEDKVCSNPACYFENNNNAASGDDTCEP